MQKVRFSIAGLSHTLAGHVRIACIYISSFPPRAPSDDSLSDGTTDTPPGWRDPDDDTDEEDACGSPVLMDNTNFPTPEQAKPTPTRRTPKAALKRIQAASTKDYSKQDLNTDGRTTRQETHTVERILDGDKLTAEEMAALGEEAEEEILKWAQRAEETAMEASNQAAELVNQAESGALRSARKRKTPAEAPAAASAKKAKKTPAKTPATKGKGSKRKAAEEEALDDTVTPRRSSRRGK